MNFLTMLFKSAKDGQSDIKDIRLGSFHKNLTKCIQTFEDIRIISKTESSFKSVSDGDNRHNRHNRHKMRK